MIVDKGIHNDLTEIVNEHTSKMNALFPDNCFQKLFWMQQQKVSALKTARSMQWHPLMIKWCLYLSGRVLFAQSGIPESIVWDNSPQFIAGDFQEFCQLMGIHHVRVAPYQPYNSSTITNIPGYVSFLMVRKCLLKDRAKEKHGCLVNFTLTFPHIFGCQTPC